MAVPQRGVAVRARERTPARELGADAGFAGRVRRLAAVSVPGLGAIALLAHLTLELPAALHASLVAGWVTMPTLLVLSLSRPAVRYALAVPSSLVGVPLVLTCTRWLPDDGAAAAGWIAVSAGIALGGVLGLWFWYRLVPVPRALDDPFSPARWALVAVHVGLIVGGLATVAATLAD